MQKLPDLEALLAQFDGSSEAEWREKIARDLKGEPISDSEWEYKGVRVNPYLHQDSATSLVPLPDVPKTWKITERFVFDGDEVATNATIMDSLRGGCETAIIEVKKLPDWDLLFKDIILEAIEIDLECGEGIDPRNLNEHLAGHFGTARSRPGTIQVRVPDHVYDSTAHLAFGYGDDIPADLADGFSRVAKFLSEHDELGRVVLTIPVSTAFHIEIARIRSIHYLWNGLLEALEIEVKPQLTLEAVMQEEALSGDEHLNMIKVPTIALAAICGGVHRLIIPPASKSRPDDPFFRRISRNVHHLLRMESKLAEMPDAVRGSYVHSDLIDRITRRAWEQIPLALDN